jgi:murein hydrolase activator
MTSLIKTLLFFTLAIALTAGTRETYTRDEWMALETERKDAEAELARLKSGSARSLSDAEDLDAALMTGVLEARRREDEAAGAEGRLADLRTRQAQLHKALLTDERAIGDLTTALAASARRRPPALAVSPGRANEAIRRALLVNAITPQIRSRAKAARGEIETLGRTERSLRAEQMRLDAAKARLASQQIELESLAAQKRADAGRMGTGIAALQDRATRLGIEAETLRDLIAALQAIAPEAPSLKPVRAKKSGLTAVTARPAAPAAIARTTPPAKTATTDRLKKGSLLMPVTGARSVAFGDKLPGGGKAEWIAIRTRSEAQITAPATGEVEYARPFRSYGSMLILRTPENYRVILTGMSRIYVTEGQSVSAGEPVGRMPDRDDPPPELTLELRLGDSVLNPAEWLAKDE